MVNTKTGHMYSYVKLYFTVDLFWAFFYLRPPSVVNLTFFCMPILSVFCRFQRCIHTVLETPVCNKTSQELRMLSSVTINCQVTKFVLVSGSQLSEL